MSYRDFFRPRRVTPTQAQTRMAIGLAEVDPTWRGDGPAPITRGARPHPLFSNLTEGEIEISLAMMRGDDTCGE